MVVWDAAASDIARSSPVAKPGRCQNVTCSHEIKDGWTLCRPCAVALVNGSAVYLDACIAFGKHDSDPTCRECGFALELHPGTGERGVTVVFR